jgi:hypothetical protein
VVIYCWHSKHPFDIGESCPLNTQANGLGALLCNPCPDGQVTKLAGGSCSPCTSGAQIYEGTCVPCPAGYTSGSSGRCEACIPGKYSSETGSSECSSCETGKITAAYGTTPQCASCPSLSSQISTGGTTCNCDIGYYAVSIDVGNAIGLASAINFECRPCPTGVLCNLPGRTQLNLQAAAGYWRSSNSSTEFIRCLRTSHCAAGAVGCIGHRTGPLCAVCIDGWQATSLDSECVECPSKSQAGGLGALFTILIILALLILYWAALRDDTSDPFSAFALLTGGTTGKDHYRTDSGYKERSNTNSPIVASRPSLRLTPSPSRSSQTFRRSSSILSILDSVERVGGDESQAVVILTREARVPRSFTYTLKIALGFLQIAATVASGVEIPWPSAFHTFIGYFNLVNFGMIIEFRPFFLALLNQLSWKMFVNRLLTLGSSGMYCTTQLLHQILHYCSNSTNIIIGYLIVLLFTIMVFGSS